MAFVIVQYQNPSPKGIMTELLQCSTKRNVTLVKNRTKVQPGCVYVISPNKELSILHDVLHMFESTSPLSDRNGKLLGLLSTY